MSLITVEGNRIRFDLDKVLRERHLEVIPRERDELGPLLKTWYEGFARRWAKVPITVESVRAMDEEIVQMLRRASDLGHVRHVF